MINTKYNSRNTPCQANTCMSNWTLFSNHGHVLVCLARDPEARLRDVAADVGITERAVQKIVRDLQDGGMISVTKNGRRNCYRIHKKQTLRHELEAGCKLNDLLKVVNKGGEPKPSGAKKPGKSRQVVRPAAEQAGNKVKGGVVPVAKPEKTQAEPPKPGSGQPRPDKKKDSRKTRRSDALEKQQGSLF